MRKLLLCFRTRMSEESIAFISSVPAPVSNPAAGLELPMAAAAAPDLLSEPAALTALPDAVAAAEAVWAASALLVGVLSRDSSCCDLSEWRSTSCCLSESK